MTPIERERSERLRALAESLKGKTCAYGEDDCSLVPAQWVADITGKEFDWPVYSSREEAERIIEEAGGLVNVWSGIARKIGLEPVYLAPGQVPAVGDVGIIETSQGPVGGIFLFGATFLWRAERGVRVIGVRSHLLRREGDAVVRRPLILKVWRV